MSGDLRGQRFVFECMSHEVIRVRNGQECVVVDLSGDRPWYNARFDDGAVLPCHRAELLPVAPSPAPGATT